MCRRTSGLQIYLAARDELQQMVYHKTQNKIVLLKLIQNSRNFVLQSSVTPKINKSLTGNCSLLCKQIGWKLLTLQSVNINTESASSFQNCQWTFLVDFDYNQIIHTSKKYIIYTAFTAWVMASGVENIAHKLLLEPYSVTRMDGTDGSYPFDCYSY